MNLISIAILQIKGFEYRCIITGVSKSEAIKLLQNIDLIEKKQNIIKTNTKSNFETVNLNEKIENCKLKKDVKIFESIYNNGKNYKIW